MTMTHDRAYRLVTEPSEFFIEQFPCADGHHLIMPYAWSYRNNWTLRDTKTKTPILRLNHAVRELITNGDLTRSTWTALLGVCRDAENYQKWLDHIRATSDQVTAHRSSLGMTLDFRVPPYEYGCDTPHFVRGPGCKWYAARRMLGSPPLEPLHADDGLMRLLDDLAVAAVLAGA